MTQNDISKAKRFFIQALYRYLNPTASTMVCIQAHIPFICVGPLLLQTTKTI